MEHRLFGVYDRVLEARPALQRDRHQGNFKKVQLDGVSTDLVHCQCEVESKEGERTSNARHSNLSTRKEDKSVGSRVPQSGQLRKRWRFK